MEVEEGEGEMLSEVYFAKFLTSAKLINLQLRDVYFRRHVLVQILMFLQTAAAQDKLLAAQRTKIEEMESRANGLLAATAPNGALFAATVRATLQREKHWTDWKRAGCVPFDMAAVELSGQKRKAGAAGARSKRMQLGNSQLTKLWNMGSNSLEDIAANAAKSGVPTLVDFLQPVVEQMDPAAGIEEEYKLKNDKAYCWKALRLMAKKDVSLLSQVSAPGGSLEAAVKYMDDKLKGELKEEKEESALAPDAPDAPADPVEA